MSHYKKYLVEIRLKDWIANKPELVGGRVVSFEEVEATEEYFARHIAFDVFMRKTQTDPEIRKLWRKLNIEINDICTPEAIEIEPEELNNLSIPKI